MHADEAYKLAKEKKAKKGKMDDIYNAIEDSARRSYTSTFINLTDNKAFILNELNKRNYKTKQLNKYDMPNLYIISWNQDSRIPETKPVKADQGRIRQPGL